MWLKLIRQKKLQITLIFLIAAICTALLTSAVSILTSLDKPSREFARRTHSSTARVYLYSGDEADVLAMGEQFEALEQVESVQYLRNHYVDENILFNGKKQEMFVNLTEYNEGIFHSALYLEGEKSAAETLGEGECILPAGVANDLDVHIGGTVTVQYGEKDLAYTVKAVYSDAYQSNASYDSDILIQKLPTDLKSQLVLCLYGKDGVTGAEIEDAYREANDGVLNARIWPLEKRIDNGLIVGHIAGAVLLAIGFIMLIVSGLIIQYMIKNTMIADEKSIAVYKTLGYTSGDILKMYLKLYFSAVSLASFVGIAGSIFISNTVLTSMFENMGSLTADSPILPGIACYLLTVGYVLSIITCILSKTRKIKPVLALNGQDFGGVKKKKPFKGNSRLQFSALGIAARTFTRNKKDAIGIVITCAVTIFSVNFAVISLDVAGSLKDNNDYWLGIDKSDVIINVPNAADYDFVKDAVSADSRVDASFNAAYNRRIGLKWKKGITETTMDAYVYDDFSKITLPVTDGRNPISGSEIALSGKMAKILDKDLGDYLEVYLGGEKKVEFLVVGFFQSYMQLGSVCRLSSDAYADNGYPLDYNTISVYLKDSGDITSFIEDMQERVSGKGKVIRRTEHFENVMNMIASPQQQVIPIVMALVLLIAGINIFSITYLKNLKAQKTNGIYKCIGYTTAHLIGANLYYTAALAAVSILITFPISLVTYAPIMKLCQSAFGMREYAVAFNYPHLIAMNLLLLVVFGISTLVSSGSLFKVNARDLVQE